MIVAHPKEEILHVSLNKNTYKLLLFKLNYNPCQFCFVVETELFHYDIFRVGLHITCAQINFSVKPTFVGGKVQR